MTTTTTTSALGESITVFGLDEVGRRPPLARYVAQLWRRRHFILADSRARISSNTRQMMLGNLWLVLKPLLDGITYFVIFGLILNSRRDIDNFIGYLVIGVFMFQFTARCLSTGATSVVANKNLIRSFSFPRAALPLAATIRETLNMGPVIIAMLVIILVAPPHAALTWRWGLVPLVFSLQLIFNLGLALIAARAVSQVRDLNNVISFLTRFWLYGSGVFFSFESFVSHPTALTIATLNPLYIVLDIFRDLLLYGTTPELRSWAILAAWSAASVTVGLLYFWRGEERYGTA